MRKRAVLILAMAMLVAAAGVIYAHWEETLTVDVAINTGDINPVWSLDGTDDDGVLTDGLDAEPVTAADYTNPDLDPSSADPNEAGPGADRYTKNVARCTADGDGTQTISVAIENGYPSYWCTVKADLKNTGTVPVKLQSMANDKPAVITAIYTDADWMTFGYQLDPGDIVDFYISFHIENPALEKMDYDFEFTFDWVNWNEFVECDFQFEGSGDTRPGLYGGVVTPGSVTDVNCGTFPAVSTAVSQSFGSTGWGGWSCVEPGYLHIASGYVTGSVVAAQGPAKPGSIVGGQTYPDYPHYDYTPPEEGWVASATGAGILHAICMP